MFLNQGQQYENIVVPITDGMKTMQVVANLQKCYKSQGRELLGSIEKYITLAIIDNEWKEHLREMDELRRSVQNASIEQKDPLLIYKLESFNLFKAMIDRMNGEVVGFLAKAGLPSAQPQVQEAPAPRAPTTTRGDQPHGGAAVQSGDAPAPRHRRPTSGARRTGWQHAPAPAGPAANPSHPCAWTRPPAATIPVPVAAARSTSSATARTPEHGSPEQPKAPDRSGAFFVERDWNIGEPGSSECLGAAVAP